MSLIEKTVQTQLLPLFNLYNIDRESKILIAFSGGVDSVALALLLTFCLPVKNLEALYVNHRLREEGELETEERLNKENCEKLKLPLTIMRLKKGEVQRCAKERGKGVEEAARYLRYKILFEHKKRGKFDYIATAHTLDDQVETTLMRLFQGSGPLALKGIQILNDSLFRPLLSLSKEMLISIVKESSLEWSEDSTNREHTYLRNKVRHLLIPPLKELFPSYGESIRSLSKRAQTLFDFIEEEVEKLADKAVSLEEEQVVIDLEQLKKAPLTVVEHLFYRCWNLLFEKEYERLPYHHIERLLSYHTTSWPQKRRFDIYKTEGWVENKKFVWKKKEKWVAEAYHSYVYSQWTLLEGSTYLVKDEPVESPVPIEKRVLLDESRLSLPLIARSAKEGDVIELKEGSKKVKELLSSWKIPPSQRWRVPVLEDREGIVALLGGFYGGKERIAKRLLQAPLAPKSSTLYSVTDIKGQNSG